MVTVSNEQVVDQIRGMKRDPQTNYGYRKITYLLMLIGYYINHKKVYRLMKEACLLMQSIKRRGRTFARYRVVNPQGPLQVLEMDIKMVWISELRRHAYILSILDTFTRAVLHWCVGLQMTQHQVKRAWNAVIADHLQAADLLSQQIHVEVRNDNGPQFAAQLIQSFFAANYLNQVFTHPYTPQENGHIESFHNILSQSLDRQTFWSLEELEGHLTLFYDTYNNQRLHSSIAYLWPMLFWEMWDKGMINRKVNENKKVKFTLTIPYQEISGNKSLREVSCLKSRLLDGGGILHHEAIGPETL